jgi:hypothetical protein
MKISGLIIVPVFFCSFTKAQPGRVGINTSGPLTGLHVQDSGILFSHSFYLLEYSPEIDNAPLRYWCNNIS